MRIIRKHYNLISDNSGETIIEVVVAFTLLSIMLIMFSQGITFATNSNLDAQETRKKSDEAMKLLQYQKVSANRPVAGPIDSYADQSLEIDLKMYKQIYNVKISEDDENTYTYVVYSMNG